MKNLMIGVLTVLAICSAAFADRLQLNLQDDVTIVAGTTGTLRLTITGTDLSNGFSLYVENLNGWLVGATVVPGWPGMEYPPTKNEAAGDPEGTVWWVAPDSIAVEQISWNGWWVDYHIAVPAGTPVGAYMISTIISQWDDFETTYAQLGGEEDYFINDTTWFYVVPEPVSALLLGLGSLFLRRRR